MRCYRVPSPQSPPSLRTCQCNGVFVTPREGRSASDCLHPPGIPCLPPVSPLSPPVPPECSCRCEAMWGRPRLPGLSCVWKCQKFDGLGANEAKLGWSLCMPSTMLTRVLTPDLVTTMSELQLLPTPTHYTRELGLLTGYTSAQCSRQCLKQHPSYLEISLYGCRKESLNECDTTWAPSNTTPRFSLCPV